MHGLCLELVCFSFQFELPAQLFVSPERMENKIFLFVPKKNISHDLFWKCQCINIALVRALKPRVGIILLSFGAFLGNLGFNQAEHGPFSETRGFWSSVLCFHHGMLFPVKEAMLIIREACRATYCSKLKGCSREIIYGERRTWALFG